MPNWVMQDLNVVGPKSIVDRFVRVGFKRSRSVDDGGDNLLIFTQVCPLKHFESKIAYSHDSGVVLGHYRTKAQACFSLITSWDYPAEFYAGLAKEWLGLTFACTVNEDMGQFGGVIVGIEGEVHNLVYDYDGNYDRREHRRRIRAVLRRYFAFVQRDRTWRIMPHRPWQQGYMPFDAVFDDDFWFYFRTREEMKALASRYPSKYAMRQDAGSWRRALLR